MNLSPSETTFFKCLESANMNTILGASIQVVIRNPNENNVRQIIKELKEQVLDNAPAVMTVLGEKCFDELLQL